MIKKCSVECIPASQVQAKSRMYCEQADKKTFVRKCRTPEYLDMFAFEEDECSPRGCMRDGVQELETHQEPQFQDAMAACSNI